MRQWIRSHLTYANVISTLCLFLILGGGTALAAYVVSSNSQVGPGTISGHKPPTGDHANIIANSINGTDIANQSGVDTCKAPLTAKYGPICVGSDGGARPWLIATQYCASYGLRLPTHSEAITLAINYDVPGVDDSQRFWTDDKAIDSGQDVAETVSDNGFEAGWVADLPNRQAQTVCVTDPSA